MSTPAIARSVAMQSAISPIAAESRTKIVATVGPACRDEAGLANLIAAGVDVFRLNMAHASRDEHGEVVRSLRKLSQAAGRPVGILADLAGPKIRLGELAGGERDLLEGETIRFVQGAARNDPNELVTSYEPLVNELAVGNSVMLADGTVALEVVAKGADYAECVVVQPGLIRSRQGVNLPGVQLSVPSISEEDWKNAVWASEVGIDFVGLSFVRSPVEVRLLKEFLHTRGSKAKVIAKIEKQEALDQLEAILEATDGIMVARGDLGVEIDVARTPMVQKQIIAICHRYQKPVIVATQMLDSMQRSRLPTRAEVTDVANAILDGADACMLSGETAIGEHPRLAVEMMHRIAIATEPHYFQRPPLAMPDKLAEGLLPITQAVIHGAARIATDLGAKMIVAASRSGMTALALSKLRSYVPTIGVSDSEATLRQMCLYWGVTPLRGAPTKDFMQILEHVSRWGAKERRLLKGDYIVLAVGAGMDTGGHNVAIVHEVR
jgi:pyruvate kinase